MNIPPTPITAALVLSGGTAATWTAIDISTAIPVNATWTWGALSAYTSPNYSYLAPASDGKGQVAAIGGTVIPFFLPLITSQTLYYQADAGGSCSVTITGYLR